MSREDWVRLYDELVEVYLSRKDVLELDSRLRRAGLELGLLGININGNTILSRRGRELVNQKLA